MFWRDKNGERRATVITKITPCFTKKTAKFEVKCVDTWPHYLRLKLKWNTIIYLKWNSEDSEGIKLKHFDLRLSNLTIKMSDNVKQIGLHMKNWDKEFLAAFYQKELNGEEKALDKGIREEHGLYGSYTLQKVACIESYFAYTFGIAAKIEFTDETQMNIVNGIIEVEKTLLET